LVVEQPQSTRVEGAGIVMKSCDFKFPITYQALTQVEGELSKESLQFCILCLGLLEDGDVGVGIFP
jgi:hypothetical protein